MDRRTRRRSLGTHSWLHSEEGGVGPTRNEELGFVPFSSLPPSPHMTDFSVLNALILLVMIREPKTSPNGSVRSYGADPPARKTTLLRLDVAAAPRLPVTICYFLMHKVPDLQENSGQGRGVGQGILNPILCSKRKKIVFFFSFLHRRNAKSGCVYKRLELTASENGRNKPVQRLRNPSKDLLPFFIPKNLFF